MIKINLLPVKRKKKPKPISALFFSGVFISILAVLVIGYLFFYYTNKVSELKAQKAAKESKIVELKAKIKEVENYEKDNKVYEEKKNIIELLKRKQNAPLRLLDEVSAMLPKGVWLTSLVETGGAVNLEGYAFTNSDLVGYVDNLKGSKYLTDVALLESKQATIENATVYQFKMTLKVKV
ncbi:MAG: PilN domain-containing protein [Nitrospirae bacterium]|nr:PilN domain-containing protein [Nitrospirota bacterium]